MLDMEKTLRNLKGMEVTDDFENDVICAFENDCEEEVIVNKVDGRYEDYIAYENREDAPCVCLKIENGIVANAYETC